MAYCFSFLQDGLIYTFCSTILLMSIRCTCLLFNAFDLRQFSNACDMNSPPRSDLKDLTFELSFNSCYDARSQYFSQSVTARCFLFFSFPHLITSSIRGWHSHLHIISLFPSCSSIPSVMVSLFQPKQSPTKSHRRAASIQEQSPHLIKQPWHQEVDQSLVPYQKTPIPTTNSSPYHLETPTMPPGKSSALPSRLTVQTKPSTVARNSTMSGTHSEMVLPACCHCKKHLNP